MRYPFESKGNSTQARRMHYHMTADLESKQILTRCAAGMKACNPEDLSLLHNTPDWIIVKTRGRNVYVAGQIKYAATEVIKLPRRFKDITEAKTVWLGGRGRRIKDHDIAKIIVKAIRGMI